jgi:hypothetical protein
MRRRCRPNFGKIEPKQPLGRNILRARATGVSDIAFVVLLRSWVRFAREKRYHRIDLKLFGAPRVGILAVSKDRPEFDQNQVSAGCFNAGNAFRGYPS